MGKWGNPLIFSISGTDMENKLLPLLPIKHFTQLRWKTARFPLVLLPTHLSPEEEALVVSGVLCRSSFSHPSNPLFPLGFALLLCPFTKSRCCRQVQHPAEVLQALGRAGGLLHLFFRMNFYLCIPWWHLPVSWKHDTVDFAWACNSTLPSAPLLGECCLFGCSLPGTSAVAAPKCSYLYLSLLNISGTFLYFFWDPFDG